MADFYTENKKKNPVYGIIGAIAVFVVGGLLGYILNGSDHIKKATMSEQQCNTISENMINAVKNSQIELIEELNKIYSENCVDREFLKTAQENTESACEIFEEITKKELMEKDSWEDSKHLHNAKLYASMFEKGCKENSSKYKNLALRELEVVKLLNHGIKEEKAWDIVGVYKVLKMSSDEGIKEIDNMDIYVDWDYAETEEEHNIKVNNIKKEMKKYFNE